MKVKTIEIAWHRRPEATHNDPVLSVDFLDETVFATGGGDHEVKVIYRSIDYLQIWKLNTTGEEPVVEYCYSLKGHMQSVNVVRFSPDKKLLASAGDDGCIIIWRLRQNVCRNWCEITKENCFEKKCIRGHAMDIYDISWCPNSQFLVSSGTDSNVIIWGIDGTQYYRIHDHSGYIQGVDWSKDDTTIISVANDRTARVYSYARGRVNTCLQVEDFDASQSSAFRNDHRISRNIVNNRVLGCKAVLKKLLFDKAQDTEADDGENYTAVISTAEKPIVTTESEAKGSGAPIKSTKGYFMFLGDTVPSFYRRPSSSFDGLLTVIPCGVNLEKEGATPRNCSYMYLNGVFERPVLCLPAFNYPTVVCRFAQPRYARLAGNEKGVLDLVGLSYAHVFAVTTTEEVFIYSTNNLEPLYYVSNIHYAQICDFTWSSDGRFAFTASSDGYCTLFQFEEGELGKCI